LNIHGMGGDGYMGSQDDGKYTNPGSKPYRYRFVLEYAEQK